MEPRSALHASESGFTWQMWWYRHWHSRRPRVHGARPSHSGTPAEAHGPPCCGFRASLHVPTSPVKSTVMASMLAHGQSFAVPGPHASPIGQGMQAGFHRPSVGNRAALLQGVGLAGQRPMGSLMGQSKLDCGWTVALRAGGEVGMLLKKGVIVLEEGVMPVMVRAVCEWVVRHMSM